MVLLGCNKSRILCDIKVPIGLQRVEIKERKKNGKVKQPVDQGNFMFSIVSLYSF